ncbi:hypothetical protein O9G_002887 [Rozella allomycis CSF55]|uniref:Uncharacterized protein n=1 Tax=Rozella allomycis (strain CSF55) TaxID=988480 RepID=A0A075AS67_ROZAC|nr:hypothetical protein O9G_002887 [Rozella allomycis CSF55]|eukprot:EPZ33086.1 hypothetical protein O9G_002887 [Rozella allomycis CSF55]
MLSEFKEAVTNAYNTIKKRSNLMCAIFVLVALSLFLCMMSLLFRSAKLMKVSTQVGVCCSGILWFLCGICFIIASLLSLSCNLVTVKKLKPISPYFSELGIPLSPSQIDDIYEQLDACNGNGTLFNIIESAASITIPDIKSQVESVLENFDFNSLADSIGLQ